MCAYNVAVQLPVLSTSQFETSTSVPQASELLNI